MIGSFLLSGFLPWGRSLLSGTLAIVMPSTRMSSQEWPRRCHFLLYKHSAPDILLQQKKQTNSQVHCLLQHWVMPITDFCSRNTELHGRESGVYFVHSKGLFWYLLCCCCNSVMPFFIRKILGDLWVQNIPVGSPLCSPQYLHSLQLLSCPHVWASTLNIGDRKTNTTQHNSLRVSSL